MSKIEYQREWSPEVIGAFGFNFRGSLALLLTSHVSLGEVLTALKLSTSINEIKIFTWQRDLIS